MKKLMIIAVSFLLVGCNSTAMDDVEPVGKRADLTHICILERSNPTLQGYAEAMQRSLKMKKITSDVVIDKPNEKCHFTLRSGVKPQGSRYLRAAKIRLYERTTEGNELLGSLVYRQVRGEERQIVEKTGLQGQTDRIVAELFKNY